MNLVFVTEARFIRNINNQVYSIDGTFTTKLWERYLSYFDNLIIVSRVKYSTDYSAEPEYCANSDRVTFIDIPYYVGTGAFLSKFFQIKQIIRTRLPIEDCTYLLRVPGILCTQVIRHLVNINKNYHLEVVGDPWDVFAAGSVKTSFRPLIRLYFYLKLKLIVKKAKSVLYVTQYKLQKRYPASEGVFTTYASNISLKANHNNQHSKRWKTKPVWKLISVGSLAQMYKGPDIALKAIKLLIEGGLNCELTWLGDGIYKSQMESYAERLGISSNVKFMGNVLSESVHRFLTESDIFVLASKTEGLPRAVIEAMAVGLPCIATNIGGIPELLEAKVLVPPNDAKILSKKLIELMGNEDFYNAQAIRNLKEAKLYDEIELNKRRELFYHEIKKLS